MSCGIAAAAWAITTVEVASVLTAALAASSTGALTLPAAVVAVSAASFYVYQTEDLVRTCGPVVQSKIEAQFPKKDLIQAKDAMMRNYANLVCKAPDEPNMSVDPLMSVSPQ